MEPALSSPWPERNLVYLVPPACCNKPTTSLKPHTTTTTTVLLRHALLALNCCFLLCCAHKSKPYAGWLAALCRQARRHAGAGRQAGSWCWLGIGILHPSIFSPNGARKRNCLASLGLLARAKKSKEGVSPNYSRLTTMETFPIRLEPRAVRAGQARPSRRLEEGKKGRNSGSGQQARPSAIDNNRCPLPACLPACPFPSCLVLAVLYRSDRCLLS